MDYRCLLLLVVKKSETLEAPAHLFTTGANPVSCEAALATLGMIEDEDLLTASSEKAYVRKRMDQWVNDYDFVGDVRGKGLSIGIDIVSNKQVRRELLKKHLKYVIIVLIMVLY